MATSTSEIPELLEPSVAFNYAIAAWPPGGFELQREELTLEEYTALRHHLAKLRGLAPDEDAGTPRPSPTLVMSAPPVPELEPKTVTAKKMVEMMNRCIAVIEGERDVALKLQDERADLIPKGLMEALLLAEILSDWDCGNSADRYPDECSLVSAIRGTLEL